MATFGLLMLLELMQPIFKGTFPVRLFLVGVILAVWYDGLWAGLLATLLNALASVYFLAEPFGSWQVVQDSEQVRIPLFMGVGCALSAVIVHLRQAAESSLRDALLRAKQLQDESATRQQAEDALRIREQELRQARELLEAVTGGTKVLVATADEQVIYWNPRRPRNAWLLTSRRGNRTVGTDARYLSLWTLDGARMLELDEWPMRRIKPGEPVRNLELRVRRPDQGWERIFAYSGTLVETGVGERLIFLTCHDLTELRRAERVLLEADQRKTEFLAILAPELRNPLAPIRSATCILKFGNR